MKRLLFTILGIVLIAPASGAYLLNARGRAKHIQQADKAVITLKQLEEMFAKMRAETNWDIDGEMLWGYFFTDPNRSKLDRLAGHLGRNGYHVLGIHDADDKSTQVLHVERIERHTPKTLHQRNTDLSKLAKQFGVESYDGMDVGPVKKN
jgi:hypothetical protein